jgi:hypothetical protein
MAPDLRRKVDETRRARLALEEGMRQQQNAQVCFPLQSNSHHTILFFKYPLGGPRVRQTDLGRPSRKVIYRTVLRACLALFLSCYMMVTLLINRQALDACMILAKNIHNIPPAVLSRM